MPRNADVRVDDAAKTTVVVNGKPTFTSARTLAALVACRGFAEGQVATALNGAFVPKSARGDTPLREGDSIEIVAPRQGG